MRKTAAWNVMGVDRSTQTIAEEAARRAGMSLADWLDEVVAEQATEQGVAAEDLTEDDRLDAIGERLDQLSRRERGAASTTAPRAARARDEVFPPRAATHDDGIAEARLEATIAKIDSRAARNEERTAKALESVAQWIERTEGERARERPRREATEESQRREAARDDRRRERTAADDFDDPMERATRRGEPEGAKNLARSRLDLEEAVQRIQRRRSELDIRHGVERGPPREASDLRPAPAPPAFAAPTRAEPQPAPAPVPQANVAVDALRQEIVELEARLHRLGQERWTRERTHAPAAPPETPAAPAPRDRRLTSGETEALRSELAAMRRALGELAPRNANAALEGAVVDLGRRLDAMRKAAVNGDSLRPLEEMLRQVMDLLRRQDTQAAAKGVEGDLKALSGRIDALTRAAVDPALIEQIRQQTEDVRQMLAKAAQGTPIAKLERQIERLAEGAERLASHPAPQPEIERLVAMFADTRTQIERAVSPTFLQTIERRLESLGARIDDALARPAPAVDFSPIEELVRRVDNLKTVVERQADKPAALKLEAALAEIGRKLDRPSPAPTLDARPFEELARRVEGLKTAVERHAAVAPENPKLEAALAEIGRKLDRPLPVPSLDARPLEDIARRVESLKAAMERHAAVTPENAKLEAALAEIGRKLDRPLPAPTLDARPFEELARRVEGLKGAVDRQASMPAATARLETTLAEIGEKLERMAAAPTRDARPLEDLSRRFETLMNAVEPQAGNPAAIAKLDAALAEIGQKLDRLGATPASDDRPVEDLSRRLDAMRAAFERKTASLPTTAELESGMNEIGRKLERLSTLPSFDPRPIEDLAQRFDGLRTLLERRSPVAPSTAKLEAGMADIGERLERLAAAPTFDPRPIEDLSRRLDDLRNAVELQAATAPANTAIEAALADVSRKLDRPAPAAVFDARPIEDLTQRMEGLRAAVEHQAEVVELGDKLGAAIAEIGRKLDRPQQGLAEQMAIKSTLQALSARVEDGFRKIGSAPPDSGRSVGALELELLDEIARGLEEMRGAIGRHGDIGASASRLEAAVADLSNRMEVANEPASDRAALNETLQLLISRLRAPNPADDGGLHHLGARIEALHASLEHHSEIAPQLSHLSAELAEIRQRLSAQGQSAQDTRSLMEVVQELSDKFDRRGSSNVDLREMETLTREALARPSRVDTSPIESMIEDLGRRMEATAGANFDLAPLVDWMTKIETRLEAVDPTPFAQAVRDLGERIDQREPAALDARQIEQAATLIAQRLPAPSALGADAELLLQHLAEIHERLDRLGGASGSNAALEKSVADLAAEFENTRELLASVVEPAALASGIVDDIADLKTEHASAERRMATRLTRVQDILEQLSDRLRLIERGESVRAGGREPPAAAQTSPVVGGGFDFNDIPDRPRAAAARLATAAASLPAARPVTDATSLLLEPGAGAPRGKFKKADAQPRSTEDEDAPKSTDLQAHIAAARRAAMAEMNARREQAGASADAAVKRGSAPLAALKQAQSVVANRRVPFLVGATLLVAAATAAIYELRGGHLPLIQKSELAPAVEAPLVQAPAAKDSALVETAAPKIDYAPTGAVDPTKAPEAVKAPPSGLRAPADLVDAIPEGQPEPLKSAATSGDPSAETEMGLRYVEGRALPRDPKVGARWLELAANQGVVYAQYRLGALYERGVGVAKDAPLARAWYKKAADGGNARAMHNLAVLNAEDGGNGKPDYAEAAEGFRSAAEYGVHDSQYNLGVLYGRGLGVPQDLPQAWMWFSLAAQQGDADAAKKRDEVAAKMDAAQLGAAAKRLADFKPKTPAPAANEAPLPPGGWDAKAPAPQAAKRPPGAKS